MKSDPARFDYSLDFKNTDFRQHPELYRVAELSQSPPPPLNPVVV
jgi:hypothetical protein